MEAKQGDGNNSDYSDKEYSYDEEDENDGASLKGNTYRGKQEIAFTSNEAKEKITEGMQKYPQNPEKYRHINKEMDLELVWYLKEIDERFMKS